MSQGFVKDFIKYLPSQIVPAIVGFITIPILTRLFLPADYGNYTLVLATISILSTLAGWLNMSIIRFYAHYEKDNRLEAFNNTVLILLFISLVILTAFYLLVIFILKSNMSTQLLHLFLTGALVFILTTGFQTLTQFLRVRMQVKWYIGFSVWSSIASISIGIVLVKIWGAGIDGLLWGSVLSTAICIPLLLFVTLKRIKIFKIPGISLDLSKEMAKYGFPLVVGNLAAWILNLSDRYVLELFRSSEEVGIYSVSYNISQYSVFVLITLIMLAAIPIGVKIWGEEGEEKSKEFTTRVARYFMILCVPAVVGIAILAKPIMEVLTSANYLDGYRIMGIIALGVFFLGLQQVFQFGLLFHKKTLHIMGAIIISALLNLGLNFWIIPVYGYWGAAIATLVSYGVLLLMMISISTRYFVWAFPFMSTLKILLASSVMGIAAFIINRFISATLLHLATVVGSSAVIYILMLFILREPQKEEIKELLMFRDKIFRQVGK